jgi:ubiquinone/menaquinone biosynthesis C-methylase UbiE
MFSKAIVDKGFRVVGVDISLESLRILQRAHLPVSLIQADAELLPFSDCQFKVLVCLGVWRHLIHMEWALDEICRVLKKDGNFVLGYFPPKLGGLLHISENLWGRVLVKVYNHVVRRFGYCDIAGSDLERKTLQALSKRFENVHKIDSGEHWHLLLASRPHTRLNSI